MVTMRAVQSNNEESFMNSLDVLGRRLDRITTLRRARIG